MPTHPNRVPDPVPDERPASPRRVLAAIVPTIIVIALVVISGTLSPVRPTSASTLSAVAQPDTLARPEATATPSRQNASSPSKPAAMATPALPAPRSTAARVAAQACTPVPVVTPTYTVSKCPPAGCPQPGQETGCWVTDQIWYGQTPAGISTKPVLLFVHGLTGVAQDWWTNSSAPTDPNDMYLYAYSAGYRTAFVTLQQGGGRGNDQSMFVNGPILAQQIQQVAQHFGVSTVDLVTHSKGGVDAQTAIVWDGAGPLVNQVFMLSSPNYGSPLANLECPTPVPNPITAICTMTPGYMRAYRQLTDPLQQNLNWSGHYWVAGGTAHNQGIFVTTGAILAQQDPTSGNDGFVAVDSSTVLQGSSYLFVGYVSHATIRDGHNAFPYIQAILEGGSPLSPAASTPASNPSMASRGRIVPALNLRAPVPTIRLEKSTTAAL